MQITQAMMQELRRPFEPHEHEFLNGAAYIREDAITARIEDVYPEWQLTILDMRYRQTFGSDVQVTITVRLTIGGVSRDGVGSAKVIGKTTAWNDAAKKKMPLPEDEHQEVNEAEKSAATDALKRAARLFGIGRYLLSLPSTVKDEATLARHLKSQQAEKRTEQPIDATNGNGHASTRTVTLKSFVDVLAKDGGGFYMKLETIDGETVYDFDWGTWERAKWCYEGEWRSTPGRKVLPDAPIAQITEAVGKNNATYLRITGLSEYVIEDVRV